MSSSPSSSEVSDIVAYAAAHRAGCTGTVYHHLTFLTLPLEPVRSMESSTLPPETGGLTCSCKQVLIRPWSGLVSAPCLISLAWRRVEGLWARW